MKLHELKNKNLPDNPGVYFFIGRDKKILYIGRATSLRDRVRSYFADDVIHTRGALIVDMVTTARTVEYVEADSVLEAMILEANLIKKYQPHANVKEKDDKSFNYVVITDEEFPRVMLVRGKELDTARSSAKQSLLQAEAINLKKGQHSLSPGMKYTFGPFPHGLVLREGLKIIRRIFPYRDSKCVPHSGKPCFDRQLGICPGPCVDAITREEYAKTIQSLKLFLEGRKQELLKKMEREMKAYAKAREFEKAAEVKRRLFALTHIQDMRLLKEETREEKREGAAAVPEGFFRIEGYDIAHMSGQSTGGVMVVLENHHIKKSDYRLFKIRCKKGVDDIAHLKEVLDRRLNHPEWTFPNLIVVDGNRVQKHAAEEVLKERGFDIAVVAVTKNERHKPESIAGERELALRYGKEILLVNSEAHRFAIKYHRKIRGRNLLK